MTTPIDVQQAREIINRKIEIYKGYAPGSADDRVMKEYRFLLSTLDALVKENQELRNVVRMFVYAHGNRKDKELEILSKEEVDEILIKHGLKEPTK